MHIYNYLALGDSYTIGESVPLDKSFPYQTVQLLREKEFNFSAPEIIAKTGWTIDELQEGMKVHKFLPRYDFVTVLIGVNNQYRGKDVIEFKEQFEELLKKAIELANGKKEHVIVLSIPDYSLTPFAAAMDKEKIAKDIEVFNGVNKALSIQYKVQYIDITAPSKEVVNNPHLIATDGLHPSEKEYEKWAQKLAELISSLLK
jgi:lysophospholipase L1-like esterase